MLTPSSLCSQCSATTKQSVQCRAQLLSTAAAAASGTAITTDRSKDMRTSAEIAALLPWAKAIDAEYPYRTTDGIASVVADPEPTLLPGGSMHASLPSTSPASDIIKFQDAIIQGVGQRLVGIMQDAIERPSSPPIGADAAAELAECAKAEIESRRAEADEDSD